jgi:hypothetical protein
MDEEILSQPNQTVDDFFSAAIPPEVWHYTSLAGFEGILSSGRLWATHARFTNDQQEFTHARDVAFEYLDSIKPRDQHEQYAINAARHMVYRDFRSGALSSEESEVYIVSFSAAADLKSQWSEYADRHQGVSIGFDLRKVRPPKKLRTGATFAPCVYVKNKKAELVKAALGVWTDHVTKLSRHVMDTKAIEGDIRSSKLIDRIFGTVSNRELFLKQRKEQMSVKLYAAYQESLFNLLRVASHCKQDGFFEEQEWRLAMPLSAKAPTSRRRIKFRGADSKIPYIETSLFQNEGQNLLPITRVFAGPLCIDVAKVHTILTQYGYDVPVVKSTLPLQRP